MTSLEDSLLPGPRTRLRQPAFWMALVAFLLLLGGLYTLALPRATSAPPLVNLAVHGLHQTEVLGLMSLALGIGMAWITGLVWQWQQSH